MGGVVLNEVELMTSQRTLDRAIGLGITKQELKFYTFMRAYQAYSDIYTDAWYP